MGFLPDIRLVGVNPVGFGFRLQVSHCFGEPGKFEDHPPQASHRRQPVGFALIQPQHRGPQGPAVCVHVDHGCPLAGDGHGGKPILQAPVLVPEPLAGPAKCLPENLRILLGPARLF